MNNYKIKVNNKSESKEAQELFFELGYKLFNTKSADKENISWIVSFKDGDLCLDTWDFTNHKEITLPELRTLVGLKKNPNVEPVITGIGLADSVKHWEKVRKMKEYINKTTGEYRKTAEKVTGEQWLEIPHNAYTATIRQEDVVFWDIDGAATPVKNKFDIFIDEAVDKLGASILWQRPTQPEPLPFIDDEPKQKPISITIDPNTPRSAIEINEAAMQHIVERGKTYDSRSGERSANKTAQAFNAITGKSISESDVWLLLSLLKMVRQESKTDYHKDSAEDLIAYTSLYAESLESLA